MKRIASLNQFRVKIIFLFVFIILLSSAGQSLASSGAEFLRLDIPARAGALSAGCADFIELDVYNRNAASMAGKQDPEIAFTHFTAFEEFVYEQLDAVYPRWLGGTWAGRIFYASGENFTEYDDQGLAVGTIDYHDFLLHLNYARLMSDSIEVGVGLKVLESRLDEYSSMGAALDLGMRYQTPFSWLAFGLALQNMGARTAFISEADPLPMQAVAGLGVFGEPFTGHRVKLLIDYTQSLRSTEDGFAALGMEYGFINRIFLRGGYRLENELGELSVGAGFQLANIGLDYAFQPFSDLGVAHRFTLSYVFLSQKENEVEKKITPKKPSVRAKARELKELPRHFESAVTFKIPKVDPRIKDWRFEIRDQQGTIVRTVSGMGKPPAYLKWDGKDQKGRQMPKNDQYEFVFKAEGKAIGTKKIPAFKTPRRIFVRDGKTIEPEVIFELDKKYSVAKWDLQIVNAKTKKTIQTLSGKNVLPKQVFWDGKDTRDIVAATNQKYSYLLQLVYPDQSQVVLAGKIRPIQVRQSFSKQGNRVIHIAGILFDFDSAALKPEMMDKILAANTILKKYPKRARAVCEGHSDDVGGKRYNKQLSAMRAGMVRDYMIKKTGMPSQRIQSKGYGKIRPVSRASTEKARARNRRVEIRIIIPKEK